MTCTNIPTNAGFKLFTRTSVDKTYPENNSITPLFIPAEGCKFHEFVLNMQVQSTLYVPLWRWLTIQRIVGLVRLRPNIQAVDH